MSLIFLARFTRIDILMPVTFLATKSADPKQKNCHKGMRILKYVVNTRTRHLWFKSDAELALKVLTDASDMLHSDAKDIGVSSLLIVVPITIFRPNVIVAQ